ncbi:hypothetical protein SteCoe_587 [Stentor coeruleus]|uniref:Kinesin motor domain-containing protein n=1 Tax=Stentor coeruleus TaxID=5963 RepID=A0A1R2D3M6_9CILI|nr:hypothetical protein SteCoe_587 [Stentor coeruleus]
MDSPVTIYVKLKTDEKSDVISISRDQGEISFQDSKSHTYNFARVFPGNILITEIFDVTTKPLVNLVKGGINTVVLAFGHKNTGKKEIIFGEDDVGLYHLTIDSLLDFAEEMENTKEVAVNVSVIELYNDMVHDLAYGVNNPNGFEVFEKNVEIREHLGKPIISDATMIEVRNSLEAANVLKDSLAFRKSYEVKGMEYSDRAHTFILIYLKQRMKGSTWNQATSSTLVLGSLGACERPKIKNGKEYYEQPLLSKSFGALSKVLANIKSPKLPWRDHPLTKIIKIGLADAPKLAIIVGINPHKSCTQDSIHALSFIEKCRPNQSNNLISKLTDEEINMQIQKLQEEKVELKNKLRKIIIHQENQLKKLCDVMGITEDIEGILNESNSQELEKIQARKDSVQKVEKQVKRNQELQKRFEENKVMLDKIKKLEYLNQEQHLKKIIDLKEHLQRLKDELLTIKFNSKYYEQEKVDAQSDELAKMVENSKTLINEKRIIVEKLPQTLNPLPKPINPEELKSQGKQEIIEIYRKRFADQVRIHNEETRVAIQKKDQSVSEKQKIITNMMKNFQKTRQEKKNKIKSLCKEMTSLYDLVQAQKKLLTSIQAGRFNQNLKPVNIPPDRIPEMPTESSYEELFKIIKNDKRNSHLSVKEKDFDKGKSSKVNFSESYIEPSTLKDEDLIELISNCKDAIKKSEEEFKASEIKHNNLSVKINEQNEIIKNLKTDCELYKDLYKKEQKQRNESKFLIESQRKIIDIIPLKSPKRPSSHYAYRSKK